jgi:hypothetical protein
MNRTSIEAIGLVLATLNLDDVYPAQRELLREALADAKNCDCERYKLSASMWRNEAYKHAGTPLPWEPEELLQKEYERGFIHGMQEQMRRDVEKIVRGNDAPKL